MLTYSYIVLVELYVMISSVFVLLWGGISVSRYPKQQGVFAHAADVRNGNTLIIVGGYHGNVNADLLAYTLPPMLASREGETFEPEQVCSRSAIFIS
jgi:hypothetical protein